MARAVDAIREDLAHCRRTGDILIVDNGSTDAEKALLRSLPVRCLDSGRNAGYAAALNIGIANTRADHLFLMNPDVFVRPGCVAALSRALETGAAAAGPLFFWDEEKQFLLPPTEERTTIAELAAVLARRGDSAAFRARRRWRRHAHRHWMSREPIRSYCLSGALLAVKRAAMTSIGPFDEGFQLYFEEQDWLTRLQRSGLVSLYVPAAEAVHLFNQSAANEESAREWEYESAKRYADKHSPKWSARLISWLQSRQHRTHGTEPAEISGFPPTLAIDSVDEGDETPVWVEISNLERGYPAAAARVYAGAHKSWSLCDGVLDHMTPGEYFLTVCSAAGRELFRGSFRRPASEQ